MAWELELTKSTMNLNTDKEAGNDTTVEIQRPPLIWRLKNNYHLGHVKSILHLSIPVIISQVFGIVLNTVDTIFLGHLGSRELASGALGGSIAFSVYFLVGNACLLI